MRSLACSRGKKTVTKDKLKKQKTDTLQNLHARFRDTQPTCTVGDPSFCRIRPFWIVSPTQSDRDTCLCLTHENMALLLAKLNERKVIPTQRSTAVHEMVACDISNQSCMCGECATCCDSSIQISHNVDRTASATWEISKSVKEDREIGGTKTQVTITKHITHGTINVLVGAADTLVPRFKRHHFNMKHQQADCANMSNLQYVECLVQVDYAENCLGKFAREVQAVHFSASHRQITLHTGVNYVDKDVEKTFCTLSDNTYHGPAAVSCHLRPTLTEVRRDHSCSDDNPLLQ